MKQRIGIVNYKCGNIHSVFKAIKDKNVAISIIEKAEEIQECDKIILPGVGHFARAMENLNELELLEPLNDFTLKAQKPILGICLGMQLMTNFSEEGNAKGLGWVNGEIKKFELSDTLNFKVPHSGWNSNKVSKESLLTKDMNQNPEFYFVHAYYCQLNDFTDVLMTCTYQQDFVSAFEKKNIFGVQFHPEKSHSTGLQLIDNFIKL